jgi:prophage DNA circulation protein
MAIFDDALARIGRAGIDLLDQLAAMAGIVAELAQRQEADLAPLITVSASRPLPALVWAWALYGDPSRADDLRRRAGAIHPGFLPERFEALAS